MIKVDSTDDCRYDLLMAILIGAILVVYARDGNWFAAAFLLCPCLFGIAAWCEIIWLRRNGNLSETLLGMYFLFFGVGGAIRTLVTAQEVSSDLWAVSALLALFGLGGLIPIYRGTAGLLFCRSHASR